MSPAWSGDRQLDPLPPPAARLQLEEEDPALKTGAGDTLRRSVLSRPSSRRTPRRTRSAAQFGQSGGRPGGRDGQGTLRPLKKPLPSLSLGGHRKSSLQPPKVSINGEMPPCGPGDPNFRGGLKSAPPGSVYDRTMLPEEDLSPSIFMLNELRHAASLPRLARVQVEDDEEAVPSPELSSWMSSTLASLPTKRKPILPPLKDRKPMQLVRVQTDSKETARSGKDGRSGKQKDAKSGGAAEAQSDLPSASEVLERLMQGEDGFSRTEMLRMSSTFKRFTVKGTKEVSVSDLRQIMQHLGYMMTDEDTIRRIAVKVTHNSAMEYLDFVSFCEKLTVHEHERFKDIFRTFDEDGNGRLSLGELRKFMVAIGFTPLRAMMREALELVNADGAESLGFKDMVHLLAIYRHTEGFTNTELKSLSSLFHKAKSEETSDVPMHRMPQLLQGFYGPRTKRLAKRFGSQVVGLNMGEDQNEQHSILGIRLPETLIWARRLREAEIQVYREKFQIYDKDGSNSIDVSELQSAIADLGYTLTNETIEEAMKEAEDEYSGKQEGHLDFDEFVNIMITIHTRDGFSRSELEELRETFDKFAGDTSQEVESQSLCEVLRYMGHNAWVDEVHELTVAADIDPAGSLDFSHFQWFMRLHREEELRKVRMVFQKFEDPAARGLPIRCLPSALAALGHPADSQEQHVIQKAARRGSRGSLLQPEDAAEGVVTFDGVVDAADACRALRVAEQRRCAGFSDGELQHFRELFDRFDATGAGCLGLLETGSLLEELGFMMMTAYDRDRFLVSIEKARTAAGALGAGTDSAEAPEGGPLDFWTLVQLVRALICHDDKSAMDREAKAIAQTKFGQREVEDFREIFNGCLAQEEDAADQSGMTLQGGAGGAASKELPKEAVRALLRVLGMTLDADARQRLDSKIDELNTLGRVDFSDFLRLMRWMLDTNFADILGSAAQAAGRQPDEGAE